MFQRREEGLQALTVVRLRHGRHGCLTHTRRPRSSGPDRGPSKIPHLRPPAAQSPPAAADGLHLGRKLSLRAVGSQGDSLCNSPSRLLLPLAGECFSFAAQTEGAAGVKGCQGPTPPHAFTPVEGRICRLQD